MDENKLSSISKANTLEGMGVFWDSHDFTDFDTDAPDVQFDISCAVPIDPDLLSAVEKQTHKRGIGVETLINLWLQQKLIELAPSVAVISPLCRGLKAGGGFGQDGRPPAAAPTRCCRARSG
jgi:hypothetical protein